MKSEKKRRVMITGAGIISAIGETLPDFDTSLFKGVCGIKEANLFDTTGYTCRLGGQINGKKLKERLPPRQTKRISRCDLLGLIAAKEALWHAGIDFGQVDTERMGVIMGGGAGGMLSWETFRRDLWQGKQKLNASRVLASAPCTLTDLIANHYGINGIRSTITTACSSSANAIGYAYDLIRSGDVEWVVTGGSEALSELTFSGFNSLKVMSPEPCRPFDKHRRGLSLGEGAGIVILEEHTHALERGAVMLAEMAGYAVNADAYHMTSPDPDAMGMFRVMSSALMRADIKTSEVDYINAHGTATKVNDHMEARAIQRVFGENNLARISVSSTKSMVGHCLGASGAIEAIATILALDQQTAPPTVHLDEPDSLCQLNHVANTCRQQHIRVALSNSFAFGGNNTSLVFKRVGEEL
jgi:3-oxoacyl-[acyl-carrier-protein] synthase II